MVTHYVTIQAIANIAVPSGGAVLYDLTTGYARELSLAAFSPSLNQMKTLFQGVVSVLLPPP